MNISGQHTPHVPLTLVAPAPQHQPAAQSNPDPIQGSSSASSPSSHNARHRVLNRIASETQRELGLTDAEMHGISDSTSPTLSKCFMDLQRKGLDKVQVLEIARGPHAAQALTTFHGFNALRFEMMPLQRLAQIANRDHHLSQGAWARQQTSNSASNTGDQVARHSKRIRMRSAVPAQVETSALAPELPPPPPQVEGMRAWRMNSAQIAYVRDGAIAEHREAIFNPSANDVPSTANVEVIIATGKQIYDARLRFLFPIRDLATIDQVAPAYADPENPYLCSPNVSVKKVIFTKTMEKKLCGLARENIGNGKMFPDKETFIDKVKESCSTMLTHSMRGAAAPDSNGLQIIVVKEEHCDNDMERKSLVGSYGAKPSEYAHDAQPGIWLGKVVCFFGGVKCLDQEEQAAYMAHFGEEEGEKIMKDYGVTVPPFGKSKKVVYAPYGTGDAGQLINSSFKQLSNGQLVVNSRETNAFFDPVTFELTDKDGKDRTETIAVVVQDEDAERQIKVSYGEKYKMGTPAKREPSSKGWVRVSVSPEPDGASFDHGV